MKRNHLLYIIIPAIVIFIAGCRSCPEKKVVGPFLIYPSLDKLLVYDDVDQMTFVSNLGNEMKFEKFYNRHKEIIEVKTNYSRECEFDSSIEYDLCADLEVSNYNYATEQGDTLTIWYDALISNWPGPRDWMYTYYKNIRLHATWYLAFDVGRAQWENEESIEFFKDWLEEPYELEGYKYEDVYYWDRTSGGHKLIFFTDAHGMIGFDVFDEKWIRTY